MRHVETSGRGCPEINHEGPSGPRKRLGEYLCTRAHSAYRRSQRQYCIAARAAALFLLFLTPVHAETANQRAEQEARTFFVSCAKLHEPEISRCRGNHEDFVDAYLHAKSGQVEWMTASVSHYLGLTASPSRRSGWVGIREDRREACAWVIVEHESSADADRQNILLQNFRIWCATVSPNESLAITERADQLLYELRTTPTVAPPDWKPDPKEDMITTVPPLDRQDTPAPPAH